MKSWTYFRLILLSFILASCSRNPLGEDLSQPILNLGFLLSQNCNNTLNQDASYSCTIVPEEVIASTVFSLSPDTNCTWAAINPATGVVTGVPNDNQVGTCQVVVLAIAPRRQALPLVYNVQIQNIAPTLAITNATSILEDSTLTVIRSDTDVQASEEGLGTYRFDHANATAPRCSDNATALVVDANTGSVSFAPALNYVGTCNINVLFDDGNSVANSTASSEFSITVNPVNDAPTISPITNQSTIENTAIAVSLNIFDVDSAISCAALNVSATSSAASIVAPGGIAISGTIPNCILTLSPVAFANGLTTITVFATDGSLNSSQNFDLEVVAIPDPPVLLPIANQLGTEDSPLVFNINITDPDTVLGCNSTFLSATSSNGSLLATSNITYAGLPPNCTVTMIPTLNQFGSTNIVISLTDGTNTVTQAFSATFSPTNDSPIISVISNQATNEDTLLVVNFTITDVDSPVNCVTSMSSASSNTTLLPISGINFSGTAPNCAATLTTLPDANGLTNLTFTLSDGSLSALTNFALTVNPVNDAPVLTAIPNQTTLEDTSIIVNFNLSDIDSAISCTTSMTATSSNTTLVAVTAVTFGGTAPNCTATVTSAPDQSGVVSLSFTANDGALTAIRTFTLTVTGVDDLPVLSSIANQVTNEDSSLVVNFTINDPDTAVMCTNAFLSATSSNGTLLPLAGIVYSGTAPNCSATLTPALNEYGATNLVISLADATTTVTQSFSLTVNPVNDSPVIGAIPVQNTVEGSPLLINFTLTDVDSAVSCTTDVTATSSNAALLPTANISFGGTAPNCTLTVSPVVMQNGFTNISLTATDGSLTAVRNFTLNVTAINDPPIISAITNQTMLEDGTLIVNFNINDPDNILVCSSSVTAASSNLVLLPVSGVVFGGTAPNCTATIQPTLNANGTSNLAFTVSDGSLSAAQNFSLTVTAVNDAPLLSVIANQITSEDAPLVVNFTITDVDNTLACNTSVAVTSSNAALIPVSGIVFGGTAPNCTANLTSALDATGNSNLSFTVTDSALTNVQNFTFTVNSVNDAPVLSTIANQTTGEDTPLVVNFTVTDVDSLLLCSSLNLSATSSNTTLLPVASIVFGGTAPNCTATLTSGTNLNGVSNIVLTLSDNGTPNLQDIESFTFTVNVVNDAPILSTIANQTINEDGNVTVNFTIADVDNTLACNTSISVISSNAALLPQTNIVFGGTAPNCTAVLTPVADQNGLTNLAFTLTDGALSAVNNFTLTVNAVNDAPTMSTIANQATLQDTPIVVNFTITDIDNLLACNTSVSSTSSNATLLPVANIVFGGTAPNCTATLTPAFLQSGVSNVSFTVTDGTLTQVQNFVFSASAINYPPTISAIANQTTNEDVSIGVNFIINDVDNTLVCNTAMSATSSNTAVLPVTGIVFSGTAPNCTATLTSAANANGLTNLVFTLTDGTNPVTRSFSLTVAPVNDAPALSTIANVATSENISAVVNFTISDIDSTLSCSTALTAGSSNTTLMPVAGISFSGAAPNCTATLAAAPGQNGISSISLTVTDGALTDVKNFTLTVTPVNDPPVISVIANQTTSEDTPLVVNFTITDIDDVLACNTSVSATSSNASLLAVSGIVFGGTAPNCTATLTSLIDANGASNLSFTVTDGNLTQLRNFTYSVAPTNDPPVMPVIANQTSAEDTALVVNFTITDVDSTLNCSTSMIATSSNTTLIAVAGIAFAGTAPNCTATLTSGLNAVGVSTLGFTVTDGAGLIDTKNFTFTVTPANDAPVLSTIANQTTSEDVPLVVNFVITDVDSTLNCSSSMSATSSNTTLLPLTGIAFGGVAPNCTATLTSTADLFGVTNLAFTLTDGALVDVKNFTLTVTNINDSPVIATIANQTTTEDTPLVVNFTITDIDNTLACNTAVSATSSNTALQPVAGIVFGGTVPNCTATLTPAPDTNGISNLAFTVTDGTLTDVKNFTFTVIAVNDAPVLAAITNRTTSEDVPLAVNFTITDVDSTLNCSTSMAATSSNAVLLPVSGIAFSGTTPNCTATLTSLPDQNGVTNLSFTVSDGSLTNVKNFTLTVTAVNDAPILSAIANQTTAEDTAVVVNFTVTDVDSILVCSTLNLAATSSNSSMLPVANIVLGGTAPNCTATLTPALDANGTTNLALTLMDNGAPNLQDVKNFTLTVNPVNDAPVMPLIANQTTLEDTAVVVNFNISDVDNVLTCATSMTASTSNATIISVGSVVFGGTAPNCTATITPLLNQNGNVNLTFRASDGTLFQDRTFQVTVTAVDDAPVISAITNRTIIEDATETVNFTITDVDSVLSCTTSMTATSSNAALLPVSAIVFSGTAPNCTAVLTPFANQSGLANIVFRVTDGTTPVTSSFSLTVTDVNDPPVMSAIGNRTTLEDTPIVISFTITDPDNTLSCTTSMAATSSNTALLPVASIVFAGTAPNCTATLTPAMNAFGNSNLRFTVTDGTVSVFEDFTFTVTAVNDPPVKSTIGGQITDEDTAIAIGFTISDVDSTLACNTSMSATSSDTALVPVANIVFSGTAPNCTATVTPFLNANGIVSLTFTLTDGTTPVSETFDLTVNAVNDSPVIPAITAKTTPEDTPLVVNFTITDVDSPISCTTSMNVTSSNVTLMPTASIVFGGTVPNCTATLTPALNRFGSTNISFFVSDGFATSLRTFNLAVTTVNDAPVISAISAQSTAESTPIAINFTITDVDSTLNCGSSMSMTSSNVAVIPTANVVWSGTAPNCTATVTPATGNYGTSTLGFVVTDGTLTATSTFVQTVTHINVAPTIGSIANQTIYEGRPNAISFTINDSDSTLACSAANLSATSSNTTLVPVANIVFSGTYPNCTATVSLAAGQMGTANLAVTVTDTFLTASTSFTVTGHRITSVALSPQTPIVPKNSNFSFTLTATYSDSQTRNVTTTSTWTTSNTAISSFPSAGVLNNTYSGTGVANTTVTGTYGAFSANTNATINPATVTSLIVNPTSANINVGGSIQVDCIGITSDGGAINLTQSCNWTSANAGIASVNNTNDTGQVSGVNLGSATNITATYASFSASAAITVDTNTPATSDNGTGLTARYYTGGINFNTFVSQRIDATVNFNWAAGNNPAGSADSFSARWTGFVKAPTSGTYTFYTQSDDGVRMWVNGTQIINNWTAHGSTENSGTVALVAGTKYAITLEFYENSGSAQIELRYSGPSVSKQVIPQINLYP